MKHSQKLTLEREQGRGREKKREEERKREKKKEILSTLMLLSETRDICLGNEICPKNEEWAEKKVKHCQ